MNKGKLVDFFLSAFCALLFGAVAALITIIFDVYTKNLGITISFVSIVVGVVAFALLRLGSSALTALFRDEVENL